LILLTDFFEVIIGINSLQYKSLMSKPNTLRFYKCSTKNCHKQLIFKIIDIVTNPATQANRSAAIVAVNLL
jgi:hypothetical protein